VFASKVQGSMCLRLPPTGRALCVYVSLKKGGLYVSAFASQGQGSMCLRWPPKGRALSVCVGP